jgi:hypothetical protein
MKTLPFLFALRLVLVLGLLCLCLLTRGLPLTSPGALDLTFDTGSGPDGPVYKVLVQNNGNRTTRSSSGELAAHLD